MTGKGTWLCKRQQHFPYHRGFDKTFILDATGGNNFSHHSYLPYYLESPLGFKKMEKRPSFLKIFIQANFSLTK
ncbi:MAG: hypothetical protein CM15mP22_8440 [Gammaproteobacteria bacterium]|nr:MAG: hypothetical protein CM15mP22_8440 [Gammaproteobacteria bacterium]